MNKKIRKVFNIIFIAFFIILVIGLVINMMNSKSNITQEDEEVEQSFTMPIFKALKDGDIEEVKSILKDGEDINIKSSTSLSSLLHIAIIENQTEIAMYLIEQGIDVDCVDLIGNTPVMLAVYYDNVVVFDAIKERCNLFAEDSNGNTLLHLAASSGDVLFYELVNIGIDINKKNNNNCTALVYSKGLNMFNEVEKMMNINTLSKEDAATILFNAIDENIVKEIIDKGYIEVNYLDEQGNNALVNAYVYGNTEVFNVLIDLGINVNNQNDTGDTVLHYCVEDNMLEYIQLLIENNANKRIENDKGLTPVDIANQFENKEALKILGE